MKSFARGLVLAVICTAATGCGGGSSSAAGGMGGGDAGDISGPPVINPEFNARMPRKCNAVQHVPSAAEAAALAQCRTEKGGEKGAVDPLIYLWQNVQVQMGESRPYAYNSDSSLNDVDTTSPVYPIRVTGDQISCSGAPTCKSNHSDAVGGTCFHTTFGDWQCTFDQLSGSGNFADVPPPTTY